MDGGVLGARDHLKIRRAIVVGVFIAMVDKQPVRDRAVGLCHTGIIPAWT